MTLLLDTPPRRASRGGRRPARRPAWDAALRPPVVSTFLHEGRFALVTNARFVPGPGNLVKTGHFAFDQCWTGHCWSELIGTALVFESRDLAQRYLDEHRERLETGLVAH